MNRQEVIHLQTRMHRGPGCPTYGSAWVPDPGDPDVREITHDDACELVRWLDRQMLFDNVLNAVMLEFSGEGVVFDADARRITVGHRYHVQVDELTAELSVD